MISNVIDHQTIGRKTAVQQTIFLDAQVYCGKELCGKVVSAIINPAQLTLTHLVVRGIRQRPHRERFVSIRLLERCEHDAIHLSCSTTAFARLPAFEKECDVSFDMLLDSVVRADDWLSADKPMWSQIQTKTFFRNLPPRSQELPFRTVVQAENGRIGVLNKLLFNGSTNTISHLIMVYGYRWNQKELSISTEYIKTITDFAICLTLDKKTVMTFLALPTMPLKKQLSL